MAFSQGCPVRRCSLGNHPAGSRCGRCPTWAHVLQKDRHQSDRRPGEHVRLRVPQLFRVLVHLFSRRRRGAGQHGQRALLGTSTNRPEPNQSHWKRFEFHWGLQGIVNCPSVRLHCKNYYIGIPESRGDNGCCLVTIKVYAHFGVFCLHLATQRLLYLYLSCNGSHMCFWCSKCPVSFTSLSVAAAVIPLADWLVCVGNF